MILTDHFISLNTKLTSIFRVIANQYHLSFSQYCIIMKINSSGISMSQLAKNVGLDKSTLTRNIHVLVNRKLVLKQRSNDDLRVYKIFLTEAGENIKNKLFSPFNGGSRGIQSGLITPANTLLFSLFSFAITIFIGLYYVLTKSRIGIIIQAALTHPHTVSNLGHNVPLIFMGVFGVGTALAGVAGVMAGPVLTTFPGMAVVLGSIVFVIVVIGGLGSLAGAFIASILIGLLQSYAIASDLGMPDLLNILGIEFSRDHPLTDLWTLTLPQVAPILPFLLLVLVLIFRPTGLMGKREQ